MDFTRLLHLIEMGAVLNQLEKRQTVGLYSPGQYTVQHDCTGWLYWELFHQGWGQTRPLLLQVYITMCDVQTVKLITVKLIHTSIMYKLYNT